MAKIINLDGKWSEPIGRAFLAFGSIEYVVFLCFEQIPVATNCQQKQGDGLSKRIDLMVKNLSRPQWQDQVFLTLILRLQEAKALARTRNLIAHNPLVLHAFKTDAGEFGLSEAIIESGKSQKKISLSELIQFSEEAEALADELHSCLFRVNEKLSNHL